MEKMSATRFVTSLKFSQRSRRKKGVALPNPPFSGLNMVATQTKNLNGKVCFGLVVK